MSRSTTADPAHAGAVQQELFGDSRFRRFLVARTVSMLAIALVPVALAFGVLALPGASASTLSMVLAAQTTPLVLFTLAGGVVADRYPRDRVLRTSEWVSALVATGVGAMFITGWSPTWALLAMASASGTAAALVWPALMGIIPDVVPRHLLQDGNAVLGLAGNLARVGGLVTAGIVVTAVGAGWALVGAGVCFAASGVLLSLLRLPHTPLGRSGPSVWSELRGGWTEFRSRTWLWVVVLQFTVLIMVWQAAHLVLGPVVANSQLGGAGTWSTILSVEAVGLILGGLTSLQWRPSRPILAVVLLSLFSAPPYLALGLSAPLPAVLVGSFGIGFAFELLNVLWQTTMQREIPPESLSRVSSYDALGSLALGPVGVMLAGPAADRWGPNLPLVVCGVVMILSALAAVAVPGVRHLRAPGTPLPAAAGSTAGSGSGAEAGTWSGAGSGEPAQVSVDDLALGLMVDADPSSPPAVP